MNRTRFKMSLSHCCQLEANEAGRGSAPATPFDLAPETALGSLSSVALSSAQVNVSIPQTRPNEAAIQALRTVNL